MYMSTDSGGCCRTPCGAGDAIATPIDAPFVEERAWEEPDMLSMRKSTVTTMDGNDSTEEEGETHERRSVHGLRDPNLQQYVGRSGTVYAK